MTDSPNITQVSVSEEAGITVGNNFNFDKIRAFVSFTAEVAPDENPVLVAADLRALAKTHLEVRANELRSGFTSTASAVQEKVREDNTEHVPQVRAPAKTTDYVQKTTAPTSDGTTFTNNGPGDEIHVDDLTVGDLKNKVPLVAKVTTYYPFEGKGPRGGKSILDGEVEVAHWDECPWNRGDTVSITNAFQVKEYNGKLQLDLGKFAKVDILKSAPPETVDQWA